MLGTILRVLRVTGDDAATKSALTAAGATCCRPGLARQVRHQKVEQEEEEG